MTHDDLISMLRARHARLEEELRELNYGRHDFGEGEDDLVEKILASTTADLAALAHMIEEALQSRPARHQTGGPV